MKGAEGDKCPFAFNLDAAHFEVGDVVSYRIPDRFGDFPFVGTLAEVHADHVLIEPKDPTAPNARYRGTREDRPVVAASEVIAQTRHAA